MVVQVFDDRPGEHDDVLGGFLDLPHPLEIALIARDRAPSLVGLDHDLIDVYRLMIYPVLLGSGKRLFKDGVDTTALEIVETNQTGQVATVVLQRAP